MGARRSPTLYKLTFDETTDEPGLEITLRSMSIKRLKEMRAHDVSQDTEGEAVEFLAGLIAQQIVSWNREDENGQPMPPTLESLEEEEPKLIYAISAKWQEAMAGVSAPLGEGSNSGEISEVESILTEIPSESLAS
ncbi:hypothetical protein [Actinacidiphila sp. ITFR-21]|uniref:hypothetical protein n=1 Tax=Actinacidiphila sp. ITFR-21 TaxID=3075199 RepID=UPI00288ABE65|nr:hypothetical protein [Streptomyces sp. ITFR-21]WNI19176.1 hypothetical protein RLT57_28975 [Streptomyces sp. ITFR-21]